MSSSHLSPFLNNHREMYTEERKSALRAYRYSGVDKSPISKYILTPYWNWAVTLLPLWMAPNLVTLIGFMFVILSYFLVILFIPDLVGPSNRIFYFIFAAGLWIYMTMDNIDGKQARRTGTSSPLGELFDHGCDALNCPIGSIVQIASMGLGTSWQALFVLVISTWAFYLPTWEEYHTGVLYLGYVNGPTEGLLAVIFTMLISGIFGPAIWMRKLNDFFPSVSSMSLLSNVRLLDFVIVFFLGIFLTYYVPSCIISVYKDCRKKGKSFREALLQLLPMSVGTLAVSLWLLAPRSTILVDPRKFILFFTTVGIVFGKMATKIIYAYVAKCDFPRYTGLMLPLLIGTILMHSLVYFVDGDRVNTLEWSYLWSYFVICVIGYGNWIYHTIRSICEHCDIYCLSIKPKNVPSTRS